MCFLRFCLLIFLVLADCPKNHDVLWGNIVIESAVEEIEFFKVSSFIDLTFQTFFVSFKTPQETFHIARGADRSYAMILSIQDFKNISGITEYINNAKATVVILYSESNTLPQLTIRNLTKSTVLVKRRAIDLMSHYLKRVPYLKIRLVGLFYDKQQHRNIVCMSCRSKAIPTQITGGVIRSFSRKTRLKIGEFEFFPSNFGSPIVSSTAFTLLIPGKENSLGCTPLNNWAVGEEFGQTAVLLRRGGCNFISKLVHVAKMGIDLVILGNTPSVPVVEASILDKYQYERGSLEYKASLIPVLLITSNSYDSLKRIVLESEEEQSFWVSKENFGMDSLHDDYFEMFEERFWLDNVSLEIKHKNQLSKVVSSALNHGLNRKLIQSRLKELEGLLSGILNENREIKCLDSLMNC